MSADTLITGGARGHLANDPTIRMRGFRVMDSDGTLLAKAVMNPDTAQKTKERFIKKGHAAFVERTDGTVV